MVVIDLFRRGGVARGSTAVSLDGGGIGEMPDPDDIERVEVELRRDVLLAYYVWLVNNFPGMKMPITLLIPSGVVTGLLISRIDYLARLGNHLGNAFAAFSPKAADSTRRWFADMSATARADVNEDLTQERFHSIGDVEYLHLEHGRACHGAIFVPDEGALIRIRLRDVSAYFFAELNQGRPTAASTV